jgi:tetratricopeptide (TPR) repeat protein
MGYYQLAQDARQEVLRERQDGKGENEKVWAARLKDLGVRVAGMLVEMGDLESAGKHLRTLEIDPLLDEGEKKRIASMESLVWLHIGDISAAKRCLARLQPSQDPSSDLTPSVLQSLIALADGDFPTATNQLQQLHAEHPSDALISHNLSVCLLYTGRMKEAREVLEEAVDSSAEPPFQSLLFNLCTVYELCTERNRDLKMKLVERVAGMEPEGSGWERVGTDFKLGEGVKV